LHITGIENNEYLNNVSFLADVIVTLSTLVYYLFWKTPNGTINGFTFLQCDRYSIFM